MSFKPRHNCRRSIWLFSEVAFLVYRVFKCISSSLSVSHKSQVPVTAHSLIVMSDLSLKWLSTSHSFELRQPRLLLSRQVVISSKTLREPAWAYARDDHKNYDTEFLSFMRSKWLMPFITLYNYTHMLCLLSLWTSLKKEEKYVRHTLTHTYTYINMF